MAFEEGSAKTIAETVQPILTAFSRYWKVAVGPALAFLFTALFVSYKVPNYFKADTLIYSQPQRVSTRLVEAQDKDEMGERLEAVVQEVLSRPRLRAIVDRFKLYPEYRGATAIDRAIERLRKDITISPGKSQTGNKLQQTFQLAYMHSDARMAYEVTKALSNLFIEESVIDQRSEVQGTVEFLDAQLTDARKKLEETENKVQEFVRGNFGKLPEHLEQANARLINSQAQYESNTQLIAANLQRKNMLDAELREVRALAGGGGAEVGPQASFDPQESLAQLEQALVVLSSRYSEEHPDVISTKKRIAALKDEIAKGGGAKRTTPAITSGLSSKNSGLNASSVLQVKRQIAELDVQTNALRLENERLKQSIDKLQSDIEEMPIKDQELLKIRRDYTNVQKNYERLLAAREDAGIQQSLMRSQKGTQFRLVEPPEMPVNPAGPPRMLFAAGGVGLSVALFLAFPLAIFFLNSSYRSKDEVEQQLGVPVIGVIPPMITPEAIAAKRRITLLSAYVSAASLAVAVVVVFVVI